MEIALVVCGTLVLVGLLAALAWMVSHRPVGPAAYMQQNFQAAVGQGSDVLKATIMPGYISFVRQDKEVHETARAAMGAGRSGRFNSTICTGLVVDAVQAAAQGGAHVPAGGIDNRFTINIGGAPASAPPVVEVPSEVRVEDLRPRPAEPAPRPVEVQEAGG